MVKHLNNCLLYWWKTFSWLSVWVKSIWLALSTLHQSEGSESLFWMCACAPQGGRGLNKTWCVFFSLWLAQGLSKAECPETYQSTEGAVPGPPASGRRFVEGPGSSGSEARLLNSEYDSEGVQLWMRRTRGHNSDGLWDSKSLYSAAPQPASSLWDLGLALWTDRRRC